MATDDMSDVVPETVDEEIEAMGWDYSGRWKTFITLVSVFATLWLVWYLLPKEISRITLAQYTTLHLGAMILITVTLTLATKHGRSSSKGIREWYLGLSVKEKLNVPLLTIYGILGPLAALYIFVEYIPLTRERLVSYVLPDFIAGTILIVIIIDLTWRRYGSIIGGIIVFSIFYGFFGNIFPWLFKHGGLPLTRLIPTLTVEFNGVLGQITQIVAVWVFVFLVYAGILQAFGAIDLFIGVGRYIASKSQSGVPQMGMVSSMIMGAVMGSGITNVAVTGSFTIPTMKRLGLNDKTAVATESLASSGGQVLPPVMATVSFIIAQRVGIPYGEVLLAAILPALLFYLTIALGVFLYARQDDLDTEEYAWDPEEILMLVPLVFSVIVLLYTLIQLKWSPGKAGLFTIGSFIVPALLVDFLRTPTLSTLVHDVKLVFEGVTEGSVKMAPLTVMIAGIGIVVEILGVTGVANKVALRIVLLAGGVLLFAALLVAVLDIVFGMMMPEIAAYLFTATLTVPVMTEFGVNPLVAHFFVFYYAVFSGITPPVALVVAVASKIGETDFIASTVRTVLIGFPALLIPFVFLFGDQLILLSFPGSIIVFAVALVGLSLLSVFVNGTYLYGTSVFRSAARGGS